MKPRMKAIRLTRKQAEAALAAINAMLAGEEHAGDWPEDVDFDDLDGAADRIADAMPPRAER